MQFLNDNFSTKFDADKQLDFSIDACRQRIILVCVYIFQNTLVCYLFAVFVSTNTNFHDPDCGFYGKYIVPGTLSAPTNKNDSLQHHEKLCITAVIIFRLLTCIYFCRIKYAISQQVLNFKNILVLVFRFILPIYTCISFYVL